MEDFEEAAKGEKEGEGGGGEVWVVERRVERDDRDDVLDDPRDDGDFDEA